MTHLDTLPVLAVGQIWQCRDQQYTARILRVRADRPDRPALIGYLYVAGVCVEGSCVWVAAPIGNCYVRWYADMVPHKHNLMVLLYAPSTA